MDSQNSGKLSSGPSVRSSVRPSVRSSARCGPVGTLVLACVDSRGSSKLRGRRAETAFPPGRRSRRLRRGPGEVGTSAEVAFSAPGAAGNPESIRKSSFSTPPLAPRFPTGSVNAPVEKTLPLKNEAVLAKASHRIKKIVVR